MTAACPGTALPVLSVTMGGSTVWRTYMTSLSSKSVNLSSWSKMINVMEKCVQVVVVLRSVGTAALTTMTTLATAALLRLIVLDKAPEYEKIFKSYRIISDLKICWDERGWSLIFKNYSKSLYGSIKLTTRPSTYQGRQVGSTKKLWLNLPRSAGLWSLFQPAKYGWCAQL